MREREREREIFIWPDSQSATGAGHSAMRMLGGWGWLVGGWGSGESHMPHMTVRVVWPNNFNHPSA